ncbi:hypothetical protein AN639_00060 [Candidatus Epulonipiscium fishelsonii]|uniref:Uncharacterized protein n=2 Tax=Candidatus Epulonipiscium fishelsonii TaxID=77094 RepID=A0ACC8XCP7_9FIRM|nr:hypothetical protein AN396_05985 [Epulopiscium sp. SCG-B11WGA-EpuloA1]ONI41610.1 hypothetical protein AN396_03370 [Epulopiscium sp. SCG-B11WGA-EpuloA1]ONI43922.1 hypothetical protein AN639_00060 [Epulopiscium sp. SCG-B05WGA-EpuloA1]
MKKEKFSTIKAPIPPGNIAQATIISVGEDKIAYLSGQISQDKEGKIINTSVEEQTTIILDNIKIIVEELGATMDDIYKCTCYVSSMGRVFDEFNKVYQNYFSFENPPVRCTVSAGVWGNLDVEIACELILP